MSDNEDSTLVTPERVQTGLPGLDTILAGGLFPGGVYMVLAPPGSGKTILANQICFHHVASGGRALYVTLLTESHSRMLSSIERLAFFDATQVGASLSYVSCYPMLQKEKLKGLLGLLRQTLSDHKATLLVIDGFLVVGALAESELETKKFIHELQVFVELSGCTTLLLSGATTGVESYALRTMVDGLFELRLDAIGMEAARTLEASKFRGSAMLVGRHLFEITDAGLTVYPRTEAHRGRKLLPPDSSFAPSAAFAVDGLDEMLGGRLRSGSVTMVLGAPGSGKTLLGLSLLAAGARAGEPGLYFGFFESPADLCRRADGVGIALSDHTKTGLVEIISQSPLGSIADALAERVLVAVRDRGVRRLFIDGLGGFTDSLIYPGRSRRFFGALCSELRALGVVTLLSDQTRHLSDIEFPEHDLTELLDTVIGLRNVERDARVHKSISLLKMREGGGDPSPREFSIGKSGFVVSSASMSVEAKRSSISRLSHPKRPPPIEKKPKRRPR